MDALPLLFSMIGLGVGLTIIVKMAWDWMQSKIWKIIIPVFTQRGNSIVWIMNEKGRLAKSKDGYSIIKMKKSKENIQPPQYDILALSETAQAVYPIFTTAKGQYFPIKTILPEYATKKLTREDFDDPKIRDKLIALMKGRTIPVKLMKPPELKVVQDTSAINWGVLEHRRLRDKYKRDEGWWNKYGQYVMNMLMMAVLVFFILYWGGKMEMVSNSMVSAADRITLGLSYLTGNAPPIIHPNATVVP